VTVTRRSRAGKDLTVRLGVSSLEAAREAEKQGLTLPRRPAGEPPEVPQDLTELDDGELMSLFGMLNRWAAFLGGQLAAAEVDESYANKLVDKLTALGQIRARGEKTATAMKASVWDNEDFQAAQDGKQQAFAYRKLVEALYNAVDRDAFLISRELTRRIGRESRDKRHERNGRD
jgi:hypothetical protein